ncbi:MAG TPA: type II toxin-antitoxin system VapC family toxin [Blastocatellia bacterium]|nr:type II toxin-antitoxin system VapC family toxin [Blastocatellia bacterium]
MKKGKAKLPLAFWDTSAIIPLCCRQPQSTRCRQVSRQFSGLVVWWGTSVEATSAFCRLNRQGIFSNTHLKQSQIILDALRLRWHEIQPLDEVRQEAERVLHLHALRGADALQLAAALVWCSKNTKGRHFVCADQNLLNAASREGFITIDVN